MTKEKAYMCPLKGCKMQASECYNIQMVHYGYNKAETLDFTFVKDKADLVCETCRFNQFYDGYYDLEKPMIIGLFIFFALPIPFSLVSWLAALFAIVTIGTKGFPINELIQSVVSLTTMLIASIYPFTYVFSLFSSLKKKTISVISFLPLLNIILFVIFWRIWIWVN